MNRGYVKLWRKTLDSGLLQNGPAWQLFGYLLLNAAYRPCRKIVDGVVAELEPGQAVFSRVRAANALGLSERNVRTALDLLKKLEIVTTRPTNKFTIITFVNWHNYQDERPAADQQNGQQTTSRATNTRPTGDQQVTSSPEATDQDKESKNIINNNIYTASASPAAESAPVFVPERQETPPVPASLPEPAALPVPKAGRAKAKASPPADEPHYRAKSGRYLTGKRLEAFERFWADFAFTRGKAEAADAWLDIPQLTGALLDHICFAARCEADGRPDLQAKGQTPKWAQGWLSSRRWEDYLATQTVPQARAAPEPWELSPEEIERRRQIGLEQTRMWRENRKLAGA